jgi:hypothetical protein
MLAAIASLFLCGGVPVQGDTQAFIVRIWQEECDSQGKGLSWRGSVEQVGSDQRRYFCKFETLVHFIQEQTGIKSRGPAPRWRALLARIRHDPN